MATPEFEAAYDAVLARWPVPVQSADIDTTYRRTHVQLSGPPDAPPLVLLPGGGGTSTAWFAVVGGLSATHRVVAVDTMGDAGRSVPGGHRMRSADDATRWLDEVLDGLGLDGLGLDGVGLAGHSYGGWIALRYALHAPQRVRRLALLDPTRCFTGMRAPFLLRAVPLLLRPTPRRQRAFLRWETDGRTLDKGWQEVLAHQGRAPAIVDPRRPDPDELRGLTLPVLVLVAELSRQHDVRDLTSNARAALPNVTVRTLRGVSHFGVLTEVAEQLTKELLEFLDDGCVRPTPRT